MKSEIIYTNKYNLPLNFCTWGSMLKDTEGEWKAWWDLLTHGIGGGGSGEKHLIGGVSGDDVAHPEGGAWKPSKGKGGGGVIGGGGNKPVGEKKIRK